MLTVDNSKGSYTKNEDYFYWAHFSKAVLPGASRIESSDISGRSVESVAFKNPDGTIALVAMNTTANATRTFQVRMNGRAFDYTLPASSAVTFLWNPGSPPQPSSYEGHIVQYDSDVQSPKASWLVRSGKRYWIPDAFSYWCFKRSGAEGPDILPAAILDRLPDQRGQHARCIPPAGTFEGHIVQWDGDTKAQKTAWLVRSGRRYWIPDTETFGCLKTRGAPGPDVLPSYVLDSLPDQLGQHASCVPPASAYEGHIVQWDGDTKAQKTAWLVRSGKRYHIPDIYSFACFKGRGVPGPEALPAAVLDSLPDQRGQQAYCIPPTGTYDGHIVQWDGDTKAQKTAWLVHSGKRFWIPDTDTFGCLKTRGAPGPDVLPSYVLDSLPDQTGQQASCTAAS